jgi:hypothetical protein
MGKEKVLCVWISVGRKLKSHSHWLWWTQLWPPRCLNSQIQIFWVLSHSLLSLVLMVVYLCIQKPTNLLLSIPTRLQSSDNSLSSSSNPPTSPPQTDQLKCNLLNNSRRIFIVSFNWNVFVDKWNLKSRFLNFLSWSKGFYGFADVSLPLARRKNKFVWIFNDPREFEFSSFSNIVFVIVSTFLLKGSRERLLRDQSFIEDIMLHYPFRTHHKRTLVEGWDFTLFSATAQRDKQQQRVWYFQKHIQDKQVCITIFSPSSFTHQSFSSYEWQMEN